MSGMDFEDLKQRLGIAVYDLDTWYFSDETAKNTLLSHFKISDLAGLGLKDCESGTIAAGVLLKYLHETQ